jgi:WD40 repeat protein
LWDLQSDSSSSHPIVLRGKNQGPPPKFNDQRVWDLATVDTNPNSLVVGGHQGDVTMVDFSPDGHWLATAGKDRTVRLWDMRAVDPTAQPYVLHGRESEVMEVWFSHDSRWLASRTQSEGVPSVYLWDLSDDRFPTRPFFLSGQVFARQFPVEQSPFSRDGKWLLTIRVNGPPRLWDLTADDASIGPVVLRGHVGTTLATAFSPDGRWLATGGAVAMQDGSLIRDETVRLWDLSSPSTQIDCVVLRGYASRCAAVTFTADSHHLVTRCEDGEVRVWELRLDTLVELARSVAGRQLTVEERERYMLPSISAPKRPVDSSRKGPPADGR